MKKALQLITIGIAAYNLFVLVEDFLDTETGKKLKTKVVDYTEPVISDAVEQAKDFAEKVMDNLEAKKEESI